MEHIGVRIRSVQLMGSPVRADHMIVSQQVIVAERFSGLCIVADGGRIAADLGLGESQLTILAAISTAKRARPATLYRRLELEQSTFSRNVALMKRRGWVAARRGEDERLPH